MFPDGEMLKQKIQGIVQLFVLFKRRDPSGVDNPVLLTTDWW